MGAGQGKSRRARTASENGPQWAEGSTDALRYTELEAPLIESLRGMGMSDEEIAEYRSEARQNRAELA